ncbi:MAG TPA: hypothetical protein VGM50_02335 [Gemmatimonadaceae bacterium]|jgi:hypothetical protein
MRTIQYAARVGTWRVREDRNPQQSQDTTFCASGARFLLGRLFATPVALAALEEIAGAGKPHSVRLSDALHNRLALVMPFVNRHAAGDWGDVGEEDWHANDDALRDGSRVMSGYDIGRGQRLWILTEADRSATTVILASEY